MEYTGISHHKYRYIRANIPIYPIQYIGILRFANLSLTFETLVLTVPWP